MTREEIVAALQNIVRCDATRYAHHESRRWDGLIPSQVEPGASIWLTPREIATALLRRMNAPVPDAIDELRARIAHENGAVRDGK